MDTLFPSLPNGKVCRFCKGEYPIDHFKIKYKPTGYRSNKCRKCTSADALARYHAKPEMKDYCREYAKKRRALDPESSRQATARWRANNPEKHRENQLRAESKRKPQKAAYRKANADRIKATAAEYRSRAADKLKAYNTVYNRENAEAVKARVKRCVAANPELYNQLHKAAKHRRKVRLTNNGPTEKFSDLEIYERDNWTCQLCGVPVDRTVKYPDPMSASLDHVLPIAKGGGHTRVNSQLAHLGCNIKKKDRIFAA